MTTITTVEDARTAMQDMVHEHGLETAQDHICTALNCREAKIFGNGDVRITGPHAYHMLSDDALVVLANALNEGI